MANSWRPEVQVEGDKWSANGLRFPTEEEARASARDLMMRWLLVKDFRAMPSDDPPNYRWTYGELKRLEDAP